MKKECNHYYKRDSFCLKDIASGRIWDCTANRRQRLAQLKKCGFEDLLMDLHCPYPKLGKD